MIQQIAACRCPQTTPPRFGICEPVCRSAEQNAIGVGIVEAEDLGHEGLRLKAKGIGQAS